MKTCGIIAEYNPFHAGHIHQLKQIRNQFDAIVVITSGYFSQRGLPSLLSPYDKTRLALEYGADLVCLLPVQYTCQSAEYFVKYAMESLHYLGIDALCFGSECHSIKQLDNWYQNLKAQPTDPSHSQQRSTPVRIQPNDLLAMYYVANCKNYNIEPFCIPRDSSFASATSLRQSFFDGNKEPFSQYFHIEQYWQNYYPYWTLRNLWMLSKYVPAEKLQIEFLNKWRNTDKYKGEVFAPENYSFEYLFATTLAGQPLAWMEGTNLPEEAFTLREHTEAYKKFQHDMHSGTILPIGDEPSGRSWTGFQSLKKDRGYLIVYRENHPEGTTEVETWLPEGVTVRCIPLMGHGKAMTAVTGKKGRLEISLPSINDYVVYKYEIKNKR